MDGWMGGEYGVVEGIWWLITVDYIDVDQATGRTQMLMREIEGTHPKLVDSKQLMAW